MGLVFYKFFFLLVITEISEFKLWWRRLVRNKKYKGMNLWNIEAKRKELTVFLFNGTNVKTRTVTAFWFFLWLAFYLIQSIVFMRLCSVFLPCWPVFCLVGKLCAEWFTVGCGITLRAVFCSPCIITVKC